MDRLILSHLSSKTYVFEDKLTKSVELIISFSECLLGQCCVAGIITQNKIFLACHFEVVTFCFTIQMPDDNMPLVCLIWSIFMLVPRGLVFTNTQLL